MFHAQCLAVHDMRVTSAQLTVELDEKLQHSWLLFDLPLLWTP